MYIYIYILYIYTYIIWRVSDQNGLSLLYIMLEIHHSGQEPLNITTYQYLHKLWKRGKKSRNRTWKYPNGGKPLIVHYGVMEKSLYSGEIFTDLCCWGDMKLQASLHKVNLYLKYCTADGSQRKVWSLNNKPLSFKWHGKFLEFCDSKFVQTYKEYLSGNENWQTCLLLITVRCKILPTIHL